MCTRIRQRHEIRRELAIRGNVDRLLNLLTNLQTEAMSLTTGVFRYKSDRNVLETLDNMDYELDGLSDVILALYDSLERR